MSATTRPISTTPTDPIEIPIDRVWRFSVEQYHEMARLGILTEDDRVELLEGILVAKMTKNPPHIVATGLAQDLLMRVVPPGWYVSVQDPVTTDESEPEPDLKVVRGDRRDHLTRRVGPVDSPLVIEVADSSLREDRTLKKRIYARAGVPTYWIVNLRDREVEVYTDPTGPTARPDYRSRRDYAPGESIPLTLDGREVGPIAVDDLLP
jgi:Uma2 family endonuclease